MKENWKPVPGYEDFYEVSDCGNVRSIAVYSAKCQRIIQRKSPRMLRQETSQDGYKRVLLSLYGQHRHFSVHRLVAFAFIPNPDNLPEVNHKDENSANNHAGNLEWCMPSYNSNYGTLPQRISKRQTNAPYHSKQVAQLSMDGKVIATFPSTREAERQTGISSDCICRVCKGRSSHAGGYKWKYVN